MDRHSVKIRRFLSEQFERSAKCDTPVTLTALCNNTINDTTTHFALRRDQSWPVDDLRFVKPLRRGKLFRHMDELTAYHEAGHAVVAMQLGAAVLSMSIDPDDDDGPRRYGEIEIGWPSDEFDDLQIRQRSVIVALAGPVAEMIHTGEPFHPGLVAEWKEDWRTAWTSAAIIAKDERKRLRFLEDVVARLHKRLSTARHWHAIAALVDQLVAHETLDEEQISDAVCDWLEAWPYD